MRTFMILYFSGRRDGGVGGYLGGLGLFLDVLGALDLHVLPRAPRTPNWSLGGRARCVRVDCIAGFHCCDLAWPPGRSTEMQAH